MRCLGLEMGVGNMLRPMRSTFVKADRMRKRGSCRYADTWPCAPVGQPLEGFIHGIGITAFG